MIKKLKFNFSIKIDRRWAVFVIWNIGDKIVVVKDRSGLKSKKNNGKEKYKFCDKLFFGKGWEKPFDL